MLGIILKRLIYFLIESDKWIVKCVRIYDYTNVYRTYTSINMMFVISKIMLILDKISLSIRRKNYGIIQVQDLISINTVSYKYIELINIIQYHTGTRFNFFFGISCFFLFFVFSFWNRTKRITRAIHYEYKCLIFFGA